MARVAPVVPSEQDHLCQDCGYMLNGLPETGNCPECGKPIAQSTINDGRAPSIWEASDNARWKAFVRTTFDVLFRPSLFYRTLATRIDSPAALKFARLHWVIASVLLSGVTSLHVLWYARDILSLPCRAGEIIPFGLFMFVIIYFALDRITRLAARLTAWEAAFRGLRMPLRAVLRGLHYHAAHYLPVALVAFAVVFGYQLLLHWRVLGAESAAGYLYVLSGVVVLSAVYLFHTYWIGMRKMMYANH